MTSPIEQTPDGMLDGLGGIEAWGQKTQAEYEAERVNMITEKTEPISLFSVAQSLFKGGYASIGQVITNLVGAITQGAFTDIVGLATFMGELTGQVEENNELIQVHGEQIADLESFIGTGTTTPIWASTGGRDLVTFPDTMMQRLYYMDDDGEGASKSLTEIPSFKPGKRFVEFAFIRGGRDTPTPVEAVRIITGDDAGLVDIDAWYLGVYVYDQPNDRMQLLWNSGNIKSVLTSQRQRYHIATGMTQEAQNDQLFAIAQLQIAPGFLQGTRSLGCIFQTGVAEQAGTVPQARHAYIGDQSVLPATIAMSALTYDKTKLMWGAIGESAT
ncbi:hypothetical protein [Rhodococcus tibetensis]|uniref:Uncharacterized protein n=1 Tax=Rhodococcus tibetensis TaxID=2965064 RepID=A0ABT1QCB4_9NOCA|nr:hypothetical protein [Rhodococcus sp. FXJ9.536]MCQ4119899.1 hypothetical protein [Rhodococcus sp. FXJ9.536]